MKNQEKFEIYDAMIDELDQQREVKIKEHEIITGNQNEVYTGVGRRILEQRAYEEKRIKLVELREEARGVSEGVEAYLKREEPLSSKFDLDSGKAKIDTSYSQPLGGKQI